MIEAQKNSVRMDREKSSFTDLCQRLMSAVLGQCRHKSLNISLRTHTFWRWFLTVQIPTYWKHTNTHVRTHKRTHPQFTIKFKITPRLTTELTQLRDNPWKFEQRPDKSSNDCSVTFFRRHVSSECETERSYARPTEPKPSDYWVDWRPSLTLLRLSRDPLFDLGQWYFHACSAHPRLCFPHRRESCVGTPGMQVKATSTFTSETREICRHRNTHTISCMFDACTHSTQWGWKSTKD